MRFEIGKHLMDARDHLWGTVRTCAALMHRDHLAEEPQRNGGICAFWRH